MIDLKILKDRWTEAGAREVFEELVLHCVRLTYPIARRVRPDPGDEGIDTFAGEFAGKSKVWQAKYFHEVGESQQKQIRKAFESVMNSSVITNVEDWTLCIPVLMSPREEKWWQGWQKRMKTKYKERTPRFHVWNHSDFVAFSTNRKLIPIFDCALQRGVTHNSTAEVLQAMRGNQPELELQDLPITSHLADAVFVKKLELAEVRQHSAARRAFYNFELLRNVVTEGGDEQELAQLNSLLMKVHALWESEFNGRAADVLPRQFYSAVNDKIKQEHRELLQCTLPAGVVHKQGSIHWWADICQAGWTDNFEDVLGGE